MQGFAYGGGRSARGQAACEQAVALSEARGLLLPERVYEWDALTCDGEALLARGHVDEALVLLREERRVDEARACGGLRAGGGGARARNSAKAASSRGVPNKRKGSPMLVRMISPIADRVDDIIRIALKATANPSTIPTAMRTTPSPSTSRRISRLCAPSARRMPISWVRRATA